MRILVSGASGFIGRHATQALVDRGDDVVAICRPGRAEATRSVVNRSIEIMEDPGAAGILTAEVARLQVDATLHLAGRLDPAPGVDELDAVVEANIGFPTRLAAAVAAAKPGSVFVATGTVWEYATPDSAGAPSIYAATKRAFAQVMAFHGSNRILETRVVILPWIYGPGQSRDSVLSLLLDAMATGDPLDATSGTAALDLLHVSDVVAGLLSALDSDLGTGRWLLSSGEVLTVHEVSHQMERIFQRPVPVRWGVLPDRPREPSGPLQSEPPLPGWRPKILFADGLRDLATDMAFPVDDDRP